ncbi:MAG: hypothetical protein ABI818_15810 [Acidobacteriota bacterium]
MNSTKGILVPAALFAFILLCTLNSAGYRYGASDLAFYLPAVLVRIDPALFPRDRSLIAAQARLTMMDETVGLLARVTGASVPLLFAVLYCATLSLLAFAIWLIAARWYRSKWTGAALLAALTLRHAIARSGTNTLEGYFHPRQLAFAIGALAIAAVLRGRLRLAAGLVLAAGFLHPTTAMWFAIWLSVATAVNEQRLRMPLLAAGAAGALLAVWLVTGGPLAGRLVIMDADWLATLVTKDYLFPLEWPAYVWLFNLASIPLIVLLYRRRRAAGLLIPGETGLVIGCLSLLLVFAAALPLNAARVALAVQLQTPRIFWMLDFLATIYVVWALAEGADGSARRAQVAALLLLLASAARGGYIRFVGFPDRPVVQFDIPDNDWGRVMAWARTTPADSEWAADPGHAAQYGTSLRVAGQRDVFVEAVKDAAIGMYARDVAIRTRDRLAVLEPFGAMTPERGRQLGAQYGLDYLVTEQPLALPLAFARGAIRVYRLR